VVPLDETLVFQTGDQVRLTGFYCDQHGHVGWCEALEIFNECGGDTALWRYVMVPPSDPDAVAGPSPVAAA
jgi:hypothetical protein